MVIEWKICDLNLDLFILKVIFFLLYNLDFKIVYCLCKNYFDRICIKLY